MTLYEDLKNAFIAITGVHSALTTFKLFLDRAIGKEGVNDIADGDLLEAAADASIRNKSELFGVVPNLVGMPILNDLYSPGFGVLVKRRVSSAYQANLLSPIDYLTHQKRFPEKLTDVRFYLSELGYNKDQEGILKDLFNYYPNAPDFVRFGVREVFKEDTVKKYGYDEDFPKEIREHMHKAGLTDEVMQWFWRAHWELPSFYNIREARWRDVIKDRELDEWLLVNDYPPYWREMLKKIIYTPYTRVDVRRMYNTGVLGRDEVKRTYRDIGYDESHAENLTKFTELNNESSKDLLSTYIKAFKEGIIEEAELKAQMSDMGYSDREIELRIQLLKVVKVVERPKKGLTLTNVKKLFNKGLIDSWTLEDMLIELNYSDDAVMYMKLLIIAESEAHKTWTAEIKKGYKYGVITRDIAVSRLTVLGYTVEAIDLSIRLLDREIEAME